MQNVSALKKKNTIKENKFNVDKLADKDDQRFLDKVDKFATNNLIINRNGKKIMGLSENFTVSTDNASIGLVFTGDTYGWKLTENV